MEGGSGFEILDHIEKMGDSAPLFFFSCQAFIDFKMEKQFGWE